jgi:hypothetical protein
MFKMIAASGVITPGPARLTGFLWGLDGTQDVTLATIFDGSDNTGRECVPTNGFEADYKGLNGATGLSIDCPAGIYAEFTCGGAAELIVYWEAL